MPPRTSKAMPPVPAPEPTTSELVQIVTNLGEANRYLPEAERAELEGAQRSVVEARRNGDLAAGHLHVL
jgi:hypothetical protein